jgi:hypothetical protein
MAAARSVTTQSSGQGELFWEVIMAIAAWPAAVLKASASDRTSAGRLLLAFRSVIGNGTRTTA